MINSKNLSKCIDYQRYCGPLNNEYYSKRPLIFTSLYLKRYGSDENITLDKIKEDEEGNWKIKQKPEKKTLHTLALVLCLHTITK